MYVLQENKLSSIEKSIPNDAQVHCLIGKGTGNQYYSKCDPSYRGIWTQEIYEVENGFKDASGILKTHTDAEYARRLLDYQWEVGTYEKMQLAAGDSIELRPNKEPREVLQIAEYTIDASGEKSISLGAPRPKFLDSWDIIQGFSGGYTDKYIQTAHESITQSVDFTPPATGSLTFDVPTDALAESILPRITLSLTLNVKSDTDLVVGRIATRIMIGSAYVRFGQFPPSTIGGLGYPEIDVTESIVAGNNTFVIYVVPESGSISQLAASATMKFYKRSEIK